MLTREEGGRVLERLAVADLLEPAVVDHADQPLMQNVEALHMGRLVARDERVRIERYRLGAGIGHLVVDGEHVFVVERDGAGEFQALAGVVAERHRRLRRQRSGRLRRPGRFRSGQAEILAALRHPAMLGVIGVRSAGRRQQHDQRARRLDRLAIVLERQIVDASALQRDRADQARRLDGDARALRQSLLAGHGGRGRWSRLRRSARLSLAAARRLWRTLLGLAAARSAAARPSGSPARDASARSNTARRTARRSTGRWPE